MTRLNQTFVFCMMLFFSASSLYAQPSSTPATGFEWQLSGAQTYTNGPISTLGASGNASIDCGTGANPTTCGVNDTSFGWDIQCASTPSTVVGTPGANFVQAQVFGNIGTLNNLELVAVPCNPGVGGTNANENWPSSTSETRRAILTNWDNLNPDAAVANGATSGTVWIPVSATLNFRDDGVGDGTGAGADELKFLVIGGNGGQCSSWDISASYDLEINAGPYGAIVGSDKKVAETINQSLTNVPDAGAGNTYHLTDNFAHGAGCGSFQGTSWYFPGGSNAGAFGTGYSEAFDILSDLQEDGSTFNIDFTSSQSIAMSRSNGNADSKVTMGPGMGGKVELIVEYQVWEIIGALPVELTSFEATKNEKTIDLFWTTASEVNSDYFLVQRSANGREWEDLAQVFSEGDTYERRSYLFQDEKPLVENYYRLKQVDIDGAVDFSEVKYLNFNNAISEIILAPNPFVDHLVIQGDTELWDYYELIDQSGRLVKRSNNQMLETSTIEAGLYFILFRRNSGALLFSQKLMKL